MSQFECVPLIAWVLCLKSVIGLHQVQNLKSCGWSNLWQSLCMLVRLVWSCVNISGLEKILKQNTEIPRKILKMNGIETKQGNISTILAREKKTILDKLLTSNIYKHLLTLLYLILLSLSYTISLSLSPFPLDFEVADEPGMSPVLNFLHISFLLRWARSDQSWFFSPF